MYEKEIIIGNRRFQIKLAQINGYSVNISDRMHSKGEAEKIRGSIINDRVVEK